jgi:transposase
MHRLAVHINYEITDRENARIVYLVYYMRQVNCPQCGVVTEEVPWGMGKHSSTKIHMQFLGHWTRKLSWKDTALEFRTSWDKVHDAVAYLVAWGWSIASWGRSALSEWTRFSMAKGTNI